MTVSGEKKTPRAATAAVAAAATAARRAAARRCCCCACCWRSTCQTIGPRPKGRRRGRGRRGRGGWEGRGRTKCGELAGRCLVFVCEGKNSRPRGRRLDQERIEAKHAKEAAYNTAKVTGVQMYVQFTQAIRLTTRYSSSTYRTKGLRGQRKHLHPWTYPIMHGGETDERIPSLRPRPAQNVRSQFNRSLVNSSR